MIRYLGKDEKLNIKDLFENGLDLSKEYVDFYFDNRIDKSYVAVNEIDGKAVSQIQLIPKTLVIGKYKVDVFFLYGACTDIMYRQQGYMKNLLSDILKDMYKDMEPFTYIVPDNESSAVYFKSLGFEYVMDKNLAKPLDQRRKATHSLINRNADVSDLIRLAIFAQSSTEKKYDVTICRDMDYLKRLKKLVDFENGNIEIYVENKVIVGYRIWMNNEIFEEVLDPTINQLSYLDSDAKPYAMARILNVRKALRLLGISGIGQVAIKLSDPVIEENNGCFLFSYEHGNVKVDNITEEELRNQEHVDVTIGELTAHVMGYKIIEGLPKTCSRDGFFINDYV